MNRRQALLTLSAALLSAACRSRKEPAVAASMPVLFAAHGAPVLLDDAQWMGELAAWAKALPKPTAVLMISAHWEARPTTLGATSATLPLIYDFYGFPERFYQSRYPAPGAPGVAARVRALLAQHGLPVAEAPDRGLDHGAYIPLMAMYPSADVPILPVSIPALDPALLFKLGQALSPLRAEGVLIMGSGFMTHNMAYAFKRGVPTWAKDFDLWAEDALTRGEVDALLDFKVKAPAAALALPTWEHYAPLLVALGAADLSAPVRFPITGFWMDSAFTKRSVQFG